MQKDGVDLDRLGIAPAQWVAVSRVMDELNGLARAFRQWDKGDGYTDELIGRVLDAAQVIDSAH